MGVRSFPAGPGVWNGRWGQRFAGPLPSQDLAVLPSGAARAELDRAGKLTALDLPPKRCGGDRNPLQQLTLAGVAIGMKLHTDLVALR